MITALYRYLDFFQGNFHGGAVIVAVLDKIVFLPTILLAAGDSISNC